MLLGKPQRFIVFIVIVFAVVIVVISFNQKRGLNHYKNMSAGRIDKFEWLPPDTSQLSVLKDGELILYGRDLIANTSFYLGPKGIVAAITNGMNCQNCHLNAGTKYLGNNYSSVYATYPKFRTRSGSIENIQKRVNDCMQRSLNATSVLDSAGKEMKAIIAYIKWLGEKVPQNISPDGSGIVNLPFLKRPADPEKGKMIYTIKCQRCHGANGEGILRIDSTGYIYPPLWNDRSYTTAAGLFRISRLAGFVRNNMPFDAPQNSSPLTDEEAWDVAAFVNSQPRPDRKFSKDWPDIASKPFDFPFGPYADGFSEKQHKYGPFEPIKNYK